jgi:hypothetical protein
MDTRAGLGGRSGVGVTRQDPILAARAIGERWLARRPCGIIAPRGDTMKITTDQILALTRGDR